ncbi:MAG: membrane protein insertion efficiency factor YidD [Actinobacteria bacterium]|nr:membrane protein insertion efficiency factor YidD [Actinomycetota bacterium]MBM3712304.1 membrane protein insertion efficiency factor YidD [Actinomycetota bacterium]
MGKYGKKIAVATLKGYKKYISPILPESCRFYPTCSEYAVDAINKYGVLKGSIKSLYRILRCNPFNKGGFDPVK